MDTKELQLFITLAETLHFGRTGELCHLSPSAVSRAVQRMEEELGQRLLERDRRSVRLTEAGRQFLDYARQNVSQWRQFREGIAPDYRDLRGEISLYCSVTAVYGVLAAMLADFRARYPSIELKLHTGDQADAIERVAQGLEDIAIAARPESLPRSVVFTTLMHSPLVFIAPAMPCAVAEQADALFARDAAGADWSKLPFILSERGEARVRLDRWLRRHRLKPAIYAQVSGHEAIVSMVGLGFGVGVVPELVLANSPLRDQVRVVDVQPPLTPFAIGLCTARQRLDNALVQAFWDCARASYHQGN